VAVLDATNSTEERRSFLRSRFHGKWQYLFIESICNDMEVLENNYKLKMMYSPDYRGMDTEKALADFRARIRKYEDGYETIMDRTLHYIKLIDMVTGRGYMDVNRISGYLPGKMVFFLMQVCRAGVGRPRKIWLTRHGESQFNTQDKIGGNSPLSARGQMYSQLLPDILASRIPRTADGKPFPVAGAWGPGGEKRGACRAACSGACRSSPGLGGLACRCAWRAFLLGMHAAQGWHLHLILAFNDGHKPPPRTAPPPTGASLDIHPAAHHHHRLGPALPQGAVEGAGRDPGVPPAGCPAWGWGVCVCMGGGRGGACVGGWVCEGGGTHGQERATKLCRALEAAFPLPPCYPTALPRAQRRRLLIRHRLTRHAVPGTDAAAVHAPALFHPAGCTWREGQPGGIPALRFAASTNHRLSGVPPCCRRAPATA
jgi:hypothetical protein